MVQEEAIHTIEPCGEESKCPSRRSISWTVM